MLSDLFSSGTGDVTVTFDDGARMHCAVDTFTDPWRRCDDVLMIHGIAEHGGIWAPWVPALARTARVLRPDLRGFGRSSPLPAGTRDPLPLWSRDLEALVDAMGAARVHVIATKLGAQVAFRLAEQRPSWLASLTLAGMLPSPKAALAKWVDEWIAIIEREGVAAWARRTMPGRMGSALAPEAIDWWTRTMGAAPAGSVIACLASLSTNDGPARPERVDCPTLFLMAKATATREADYGQRPANADLVALCARVPGAVIAEVEADSFHLAATHPDVCAGLAARFIAAQHAIPGTERVAA